MKISAPALALLVAACSASPADETTTDQVALVKIAPAEAGTVRRMVTVYGAADAGTSGLRVLSTPIESTLVSIDAPVGTRVSTGQAIARLRPSPGAQLELARAATEASAANAAYARAKRLRADGLVSDAEVETARAAASAANATATSLGSRNQSLTLRSPTSGTVTIISSSPGDLLAPGTAVATITAAQGIRARFGVDPNIARSVSRGASIRVFPASGGAGFAAPISSVDPVVDLQTRLASIYATIPTLARIGAGEPLRGEITVGSSGSGITVPYAALLDDGGQPYIFVVKDRIAHRRNVAVGAVNGGDASIVGEVNAGDSVIVEGGTAVEDGLKVRTK
ncbi:MAG: efflux RND transporter periplasmic adaptor subunit [Sphingomonas bacterium]|nr:efflux RND transporter periplasmic adaptor subunit [Sphingomonas bacterium]